MIKNPKEIVELGVIENINGGEFSIQQNGIDLTLDSAEIIQGGFLGIGTKTINEYIPMTVDLECYLFYPGTSYSIMFQQKIKVPEKMCAQIIQRSTLNRMGGYIISGLYDSGFENQIGAVLRVNNQIKIEKGARVAQIIFMDADEASLYNGQYQAK